MSKLVKTLSLAAGVILATVIQPVSAQQNTQNQARASGWFKTCDERETRKICSVQFLVAAGNGVNILKINLLEISGDLDRRVFQIVVPTGRSLPQGIQIQVDGKRAAAIPYLYCRPQGCTAEVKLDDTLVGVFKKGGKLDVTTLNFQGQPNPVPVTLKGFTAAYDGPPQKRDTSEERQLSLQEKLQQKADERAKEGE